MVVGWLLCVVVVGGGGVGVGGDTLPFFATLASRLFFSFFLSFFVLAGMMSLAWPAGWLAGCLVRALPAGSPYYLGELRKSDQFVFTEKIIFAKYYCSPLPPRRRDMEKTDFVAPIPRNSENNREYSKTLLGGETPPELM